MVGTATVARLGRATGAATISGYVTNSLEKETGPKWDKIRNLRAFIAEHGRPPRQGEPGYSFFKGIEKNARDERLWLYTTDQAAEIVKILHLAKKSDPARKPKCKSGSPQDRVFSALEAGEEPDPKDLGELMSRWRQVKLGRKAEALLRKHGYIAEDE